MPPEQPQTHAPMATAPPPGKQGGSTAKPTRRQPLALLLPVVMFAALTGLFGLALSMGDPSKLPSVLIGKPAPQFNLPPVSGLQRAGRPASGLSTRDLARGEPVVVNFWASWCLPCVEEHPHLLALSRNTGVAIVGINHKDLATNAVKFLAEHGNPFAAVGADANGRTSFEWGVYGMPETFIVDGRGTIVYKHVGAINAETMATRIVPALKAAGARVP